MSLVYPKHCSYIHLPALLLQPCQSLFKLLHMLPVSLYIKISFTFEVLLCAASACILALEILLLLPYAVAHSLPLATPVYASHTPISMPSPHPKPLCLV